MKRHKNWILVLTLSITFITICHNLYGSSRNILATDIIDVQNEKHAMILNPLTFYEDLIIEKNNQIFENELQQLTTLAKRGNQNAQYKLGLSYKKNRNVPQDSKEAYLEVAFRWMLEAADQGHVDAQFEVGLMYDYGYGVERDLGEAEKWYTRAANQNCESAYCHLLSLTQYKLHKSNLWIKKVPNLDTSLFNKNHRKSSWKNSLKNIKKSMLSVFERLDFSNKVRNYRE